MRLPLAAFAFALSAVPAAAGDAATLAILGFSDSGHVFAFEEYGVQDGSGFPYANRYYINTAHDLFLPNTPIRVRIDDENATVATARAEAKRRGERFVRDSELAAHRGYTAGSNSLGEQSADFQRIVTFPRPVFPAIDEPLEFRVDTVPVPVPERCQNLGDVVGLKVLRLRAEDGAPTEVLHVDRDRIPVSRGCPTGYRIVAVQTAYPEAGDAVFALVIAVEKVGFEGPDFRYIAVTGRVDG